MIERRMDLLDHGSLEMVGSWGSDEDVVRAARMSTAKGFEGWGPNCPNAPKGEEAEHDIYACEVEGMGGEYPGFACRKCKHAIDPKAGDEKLLDYLWKNAHQTPFEMAGLTFEVQAPIFVFREWHRHRVPFSYNEASARYAALPDINYIPTVDRLMLGGGHLTKQAASTGATLSPELADAFRRQLERAYSDAEMIYDWALKNGVPKELARVVLPVGRYSKMRASANLRGWLAFITLRSHPTAQWEIRQYSNRIAFLIREIFPRVYEVFLRHANKDLADALDAALIAFNNAKAFERAEALMPF